MKMLMKLWDNFKVQPDVWFFYGFLITFTLTIRKVLLFYPIQGQFNEYSGIYLYLSDIFLVLALIVWVISILQNKFSILSTIKQQIVPPQYESSTPVRMFHVEHPTGQAWNILRGKHGTIILIPLLLIIWSFISINWSDNKSISLFRSIKLLEFYFLYLYLIFNVSRGTLLRNIFRIIIFFGLFQAIIGIWQFIIQKSVGLFLLKESLISPEILGVAKIIFDGERYIRSYGLFPHPNILGGFLLLTIILSFVYNRLFHVEQFQLLSPFHKGRVGEGFLWIVIIIQFIALLLTFSKSAIIGLLIVLIYINYKKMFHPSQNVPPQYECSTWNILRGKHGTSDGTSVEHKKKIILILAILAISVVIFKPDINSLLFKSLNERVFYADVSRGTIMAHPLSGTGSGQFVLNINEFVPRPPRLGEASGTNIEPWQYQPVHNVFLLIWSELGFIGLTIFVLWLWELFQVNNKDPRLPRRMKMFHPSQNVPCGTSDGTSVEHFHSYWGGTIKTHEQSLRILKGLLLAIIFIILFDHYLWDIQQGQIILWMLAGLIVGLYNIDTISNS